MSCVVGGCSLHRHHNGGGFCRPVNTGSVSCQGCRNSSALGSFWPLVFQDCWSKVNPRKGVLPRLWSLLKSGGNGSAHIIYPNLLPFLSKIPTDVTRDGLGFYKEWFDNMLVG